MKLQQRDPKVNKRASHAPMNKIINVGTLYSHLQFPNAVFGGANVFPLLSIATFDWLFLHSLFQMK